MKVRSLEESAHRYFRNSMRAYLEGKKDLRWVTGIIGNDPLNAARAVQAFNEITTPTNPHRRTELMNWLMPRLSSKASH
jgi:hypothetical protein